MPITMALEEGNRILRVTFASPWTVEEMIQFSPQAAAWYDAAPKPIHSLLDIRQALPIPPRILQLGNTPGMNNPKAGIIAVFGGRGVVRVFADVYIKISRTNKLRFFDTEMEALTYLREVLAAEESDEATK
ncbi:MAG TPA: hypothetical protein PLD47_12225 [Aggregatilineales bacterium]|nr:hypothetical protein [Anaerolineales bacterium]HRE48483.1 hypothetical protein [Aggregatilineales bacterium]